MRTDEATTVLTAADHKWYILQGENGCKYYRLVYGYRNVRRLMETHENECRKCNP